MDNVDIDIKEGNILYATYKNQEAEIKINSTRKTANIQRSKTRMTTVTHFFNIYIEQVIRDIKQKLE